MIKNIILTALLLTAVMLASSCKKENPLAKSPLNVANSYQGNDFMQNTGEEELLISRFNHLVQVMKTGQDSSLSIEMSALMNAWNTGGAKSLKNKSGWTASASETIFFPGLVKNSGRTFNPEYADTAKFGGVYGGRLLDKGAFEIMQAVDKAAYPGLFIFQILELAKGDFDLKTLDQMLALYGAHPDFPNTPTSSKTANPDRLIANYASKRDKNDGTGYYAKINHNFLTLQSAINAGSSYQNEKNQAFEELIHNMEKAIMATSINYLYATMDNITKTNPSDLDKANALHDLSEAISFIYGFSGMNNSHILITEKEVHDILYLLKFDVDNNELYYFATKPGTCLTNILDAQNMLKEIYHFSTEEMNDYKFNWVGIQNR